MGVKLIKSLNNTSNKTLMDIHPTRHVTKMGMEIYSKILYVKSHGSLLYFHDHQEN